MVASWLPDSTNLQVWGMNRLVSFYRITFRLVQTEKIPPHSLERVVQEMASRGNSEERALFHEHLVSKAYKRPKEPMTLEERDAHRVKEIVDYQAAEYFFKRVVG